MTPDLKKRKGGCDLLDHGTSWMVQALLWAVNKQSSVFLMEKAEGCK